MPKLQGPTLRAGTGCCPSAWQGRPEAPQGSEGSHALSFPIVLEEPRRFLLCLSSSSAPGPVCCPEAGCVMPASGVPGCHGARRLRAGRRGLLLPPGVVNCSAFVVIIVTSVFKSSLSSLLLPPGSRKLTSFVGFGVPGAWFRSSQAWRWRLREQGPPLSRLHLSPRPHPGRTLSVSACLGEGAICPSSHLSCVVERFGHHLLRVQGRRGRPSPLMLWQIPKGQGEDFGMGVLASIESPLPFHPTK